jgi:hypothetical protein
MSTTTLEDETVLTNPREDTWNLGFMACFHRRYRLGDEQTHPTGGTITVEEARKIEATNTCPSADGTWEPCIVLPVYGYDHSGLAVNTTGFSCPWDSGRLGIIYAPYSRIRECYMRKRITKKTLERARASLRAEVEEYNRYLTGG